MNPNSIFRNFDQCRTSELTITRIGFWNASYVLTDGVFYYGKLESQGAMRRDMVIETADGKWLVKQLSQFSREIIIFNTENNEIVGKLIAQRWNNNVDLEMTNGFTASFKKQSIFSWAYNWWDVNLNPFINITSVFKYAIPFKISTDQNTTQKNVNFPLIMLLGLQIILLKRSQMAAH